MEYQIKTRMPVMVNLDPDGTKSRKWRSQMDVPSTLWVSVFSTVAISHGFQTPIFQPLNVDWHQRLSSEILGLQPGHRLHLWSLLSWGFEPLVLNWFPWLSIYRRSRGSIQLLVMWSSLLLQLHIHSIGFVVVRTLSI
jgi:hypothetical protein